MEFMLICKYFHRRDPAGLRSAGKGYNLGRSSLMEAILKNQFRHVSLAVSFTSSTVKESEEDTASLIMAPSRLQLQEMLCHY